MTTANHITEHNEFIADLCQRIEVTRHLMYANLWSLDERVSMVGARYVAIRSLYSDFVFCELPYPDRYLESSGQEFIDILDKHLSELAHRLTMLVVLEG